jgi:hypothetical protein
MPFPLLRRSGRAPLPCALAMAAMSGIAGVAAAPAPLQAQQVPPIAVDTRVRVAAPGAAGRRVQVVTGTVLAADSHGVTMRVDRQLHSVVLPWEAIQRLEVSAGHASRGRRAFVGLAAGLAVGGALGYAVAADCEPAVRVFGCSTRHDLALAFGAASGLAGTVLAFTAPTERWRVTHVAVRVGVVPGTEAAAMRIALSR